MDTQTAEKLIISRISASVEEIIINLFQKIKMKQVLIHFNETTIEEMDVIIDTYMAKYHHTIRKLERISTIWEKVL